MFNSQTGFLSNFIEQDGCARTVIVLLLLTTVGCISYTWGYYEGIANAQSNLMLDKLHELQLLQMSMASNGTEGRKHMGHGMRLAEVQPGKPVHTGEAPHDPAAAEVVNVATKAAAALEEAATAHGKRFMDDNKPSVTQLRGSSGVGNRKFSSAEQHMSSQKAKHARHGEEDT
ncbi:hypothetical protein PLESTB_000932400 [Pleodorina starrii]|uniref:Uncharacterized protein n=1 Tax=Pleodorina starrii TaxID=330485 RepID=A0A9W6BNJ6_9CHLO|nr:hypothetical protein PLESTM_001552800 [Pleodorina starrii]GLC55025.1 hypothetical protein PLESTB_000932400 [Pleodorina starrii]GLC68409.1 hypothetical protein PLESTF_000688400 [Pleodorina starrii]